MILSRILEHKKAELRHKQSRGYLSELKERIRDSRVHRSIVGDHVKVTRLRGVTSLGDHSEIEGD